MRLFITTSHSHALALEKASTTIQRGTDDHDVVILLNDRLLELCEPDFYDSRWAKWDVATLPIKVPFHKWQLTPRLNKKTKLIDPETKKQLELIGVSLKKASVVVNIGNPGSEGLFLVDELIEYFGYRGQVIRMLLDVKYLASAEKIELSIQDNSKYSNVYQAELCRSRAAWLIGKNMSRAVTKLLARDVLISIGRIQTPLLALVVRRCMAIESGVVMHHNYYTARSLLREMRIFARCGMHDIDALKAKEFIEFDHKTRHIKDTRLGRSLIQALPEQLTYATVAAAWENALGQVAAGNYPPEEFMRRIDIFVESRLQEIKALSGKVTISPGKSEHQSHQKTMSVPHARTADKSAASSRGQCVPKPVR